MGRRAHQRRAMTLIEVLAATVLLAILSSVWASLLRSVPALPANASEDTAAIDILALERLADQLLDDEAFSERIIADSDADFAADWPNTQGRPSVRIRRIVPEASADEPAHAWIAFSCGNVIVWRCIDLPKEIPSP